MKTLHVGLCDGRHEIEQAQEFIFDAEVKDPMDFSTHRATAYDWCFRMREQMHIDGIETVYLYVTGLSTLLTAFLWVWTNPETWYTLRPTLILMHYDRDAETYMEEHWG